jgi:hypothetical protein
MALANYATGNFSATLQVLNESDTDIPKVEEVHQLDGHDLGLRVAGASLRG